MKILISPGFDMKNVPVNENNKQNFPQEGEKEMKKVLLLTGMGILLLVSLSYAAAIPKLINYQGMLADTAGNPLTGAYSMTFKIYDDSAAGNLEWTETQAEIEVANGLFNVTLGAVTALNLAFDESYWLQVRVGNETMPRMRFTSVGYAYRSVVADSAIVAVAAGSTFDSLHVVGNAAIDGDLHMGGAITHDSPVIILDGLMFVDSTGTPVFHMELEGTESHSGETVPAALQGALIFEMKDIQNASNMEVVFWDSQNDRPGLIINEGGAQRASTFDRSLQIGKALGAATVDSNYTKFEGYSYVDGLTSGSGADLGVEDDIEAKGSIYSQENVYAEGGELVAGKDVTAYAGRVVLHDADAADGFTTTIVSNADVAASFSLTLPATDGDSNQVLTTDGSGNLSWSTDSGDSSYWNQSGSDIYYSDGNVGIGETAPAALLHLDTATTSTAQLRLEASAGTDPSSPDSGDLWFNGTNLNFYDGALTTDLLAGGAFSTTDSVTSNSSGDLANDDFVFGSDQLDDDTGTDDDIRMFFDKSKAAFRAGWVTGTEWDDANRGNYSFASGVNTTASGDISFATGFGTNASGDYATAMGNITAANGWASTAIGWSTVANGQASTAMGYNTLANISFATAMGYQTIASGENSTAMGYRSTAQPYGSVVLGRYNVISGTTDSWVDTDPVFIIGNGASAGSPSNAMTVLKNGQVGIGRTPAANELEVEGDASKSIAGDWAANSDRRIKTDIQDIDDALTTISKLRPVKFKYTTEYKHDHPSIEDVFYYNFIAQEYRDVFPQSVKGSGDFLSTGEEILQLDTYFAQIVAIKAIQELKARNDALKEQNITQQSRVTELEEENQALRRTMQSIETRLSALEQSKLLYRSAIERYRR